MITRLDPAPDPLLALAAAADRPGTAFLDGAAEPGGMGRWSYLATDPVETVECSANEWPAVRARIRERSLAQNADRRSTNADPAMPPFQGGWIGWLSYELGAAFDHQPRARHNDLHIPDISLARYTSLIAWDHLSGAAWQISNGDQRSEIGDRRASSDLRSPISDLSPGFTPLAYQAAVRRVIDYILAGDIYQANLSQRFAVPFAGDPLALYLALRRRAAGSHAAFLDRGRVKVLSMSPERFLSYDPVSRHIETRPIKGTRPRDLADSAVDASLAFELANSAKDRAENVMIVDLLRNDLHRVSRPESVVVPSLCALERHAAVHHLVSTVTAELAPGRDALDLIEATFPGGAITGAPKLRAMEIIAELEPVSRGVYCGAIGWIGDDGALELNIAIRTVVLTDGVATVSAGGGITALSDPAAEHQETLDKAQALLDALAEVA